MSDDQNRRALPTGIHRLVWRAPIWLYKLKLGWLLGGRFLLLNHIGRKSGQPRQAVLEVANYDRDSNSYTVASGFGRKSDWYQNVLKTPNVSIQVGRRKLDVAAVALSAEESGAAMVQYARAHPKAARQLVKVLGLTTDGSEASYRTISAENIPFVILNPRRKTEPV
jgi:deazaflavin-dependent oxidoreductase (nitroreductase family)